MASDPIAILSQAVQGVFERKGAEIVEWVQGNLSTPVGYRTTKKGKQRVSQRSSRGEHPRTDKGRLRREVNHSVTVEGDTITLTIEAPTPYAAELQNEMNRIVLSDVLDAKGDELLDAIVDSIQSED